MHIRFSSSLRRTGRSAGLVTVGVLSTLGALSLSHVGPASAQSPGVNLAQLVAQVNALQTTVTNQGNTITSLQSTVSSQAQTISSLRSQEQSDIQNTQNQEKSDFTKLNGSVAALQTLTKPLSLSSDPSVGGTNTLLTITGVNVQNVNGMSKTESMNGLGNLIVGYNENDPGFTQTRAGSHNLVVGMGHNYLSYGGIVAGEDCLISGPFACVTGGQFNAATSGHDSVSGGSGNVASGGSSSVTGGYSNTASGRFASISGGNNNKASSDSASVSGGYDNTATGSAIGDTGCSVSGGVGNTATGIGSSVSGGQSNTTSNGGSISGGQNLTENAFEGWKAGSESDGFTFNGDFASDH